MHYLLAAGIFEKPVCRILFNYWFLKINIWKGVLVTCIFKNWLFADWELADICKICAHTKKPVWCRPWADAEEGTGIRTPPPPPPWKISEIYRQRNAIWIPKCSWIIVQTFPLEIPRSEASSATLIRQSFSTSLSTRSIIWLATWPWVIV